MRINRWLVAGVGLTVVAALAGCAESGKLTLAEMERLRRDTDKQMRLVREQNEQINAKLNVLKAEMDTITTRYIPMLSASLDSVSAKPEQARLQMITEVENRLRTITDNVRDFKTQVNENLTSQNRALTDTLRIRLNNFDARVSKSKEYVDFVLAKQDSVNREFANRIDKRPWYISILGAWEDRQRARGQTP
jgi:hypothetical protein